MLAQWLDFQVFLFATLLLLQTLQCGLINGLKIGGCLTLTWSVACTLGEFIIPFLSVLFKNLFPFIDCIPCYNAYSIIILSNRSNISRCWIISQLSETSLYNLSTLTALMYSLEQSKVTHLYILLHLYYEACEVWISLKCGKSIERNAYSSIAHHNWLCTVWKTYKTSAFLPFPDTKRIFIIEATIFFYDQHQCECILKNIQTTITRKQHNKILET